VITVCIYKKDGSFSFYKWNKPDALVSLPLQLPKELAATRKEQNRRHQKQQQTADSENNPIQQTRSKINKKCNKPASQETNKTIQLQESPIVKRTLPSK